MLTLADRAPDDARQGARRLLAAGCGDECASGRIPGRSSRWTSVQSDDAARDAQGNNRYAYVRNNPLRYIDPNGLDARALENLPIQYTDGSPTDYYSQLEKHGDMWYLLYANGYNYSDTDIAQMEAAADALEAADATAGARQKLVVARDAARNKLEFQPGHGGTTHCNQATAFVAQQVGAPMRPLVDAGGNPLLAGDMAANLARPGSGYRPVSAGEAQTLADQGKLVIVTGQGYVATVRPDTGDKLPGKGVIVAEIGRLNQIHRLEYAFSKATLPSVRFYAIQ